MGLHINDAEIAKEMLDVLVKHKVPMCFLDGILEKVKDTAYINTLVQAYSEMTE